MTPIPPYPLSIAQAARILGVDRARIQNAITSGELPIRVYISKEKRIAPDDLLAWVNKAGVVLNTPSPSDNGGAR